MNRAVLAIVFSAWASVCFAQASVVTPSREPTVQELAVRIEAVEKAVSLAHEDLVRVPTSVDKAVSTLRELVEEKIAANDKVSQERFHGISGQFDERDKRADLLTIQQKDAADKLAKSQSDNTSLALSAQKDAADKSEKGTFGQLAEQRTLFQADINALNVQINDLKSRLDRSEGHGNGSDDTVKWIFAGLAAVFGAAAFFLAIDRRRGVHIA